MTQAVMPWNVTTVNNYNTLSGPVTLTTDDLLVNQIIYVTDNSNNLITPTAAQLVAAGQPVVNSCFRFHITDSGAGGGGGINLQAGAGVTLLAGGGSSPTFAAGTTIEVIGRFTNIGAGTEAVILY